MSKHQTLGNYEGSLYGQPRYEPDGIGYDFEVPDNLVVATPGGVSTQHHHWTKGFYGRGNTSSDIYAGQGQRYISGEYGNLYQSGQSSAENYGMYPAARDYKYWMNGAPSQYAQQQGIESVWSPNLKEYTPDQAGRYQEEAPGLQQLHDEPGQKKVERYTRIGEIAHDQPQQQDEEDTGFELIGDESVDVSNTPPSEPHDTVASTLFTSADTPTGDTPVDTPTGGTTVIMPSISPWALFFLFLMAFITFDFWATAGHMFVRQKLHGGKSITWQRAIMYAVLITLAFALMAWLSGVPITTFETL